MDRPGEGDGRPDATERHADPADPSEHRELVTRGDLNAHANRETPSEVRRADAGTAGQGEQDIEPDIESDAEPDIEPDAGTRNARALDNRAKVDAAVRAYAIDQGYERVSEIEKGTVTPAMRRIEAEDPERHLAGLENRLKGKDRLAEKVEFDVMKKGVTVEQAFGNVKDAIRYTFCYPVERYAEGVRADCGRLEAEGFQFIERPNSWDKEQYKGINSRWRVPDSGQLFEVQFHTRASLEAKESTHWAYEKLRAGVPPAEQKELEEYQKQLTAQVPIPPGALDIPDYP